MHLKAIVWDKLVSWLDNCLGTGSLNETLLAESVLIIFQHSILTFFVKRHACPYMCRPTV